MEVPPLLGSAPGCPSLWVDTCPLLSAYGSYTLLSRGPDVDSEKTWHCLKDVIICRVIKSISQNIGNRKEIHDLNYLGVRGFSEAS